MPILGECSHPAASDSNGSHQPGAETYWRPAGVQWMRSFAGRGAKGPVHAAKQTFGWQTADRAQ